MNYKTNITELIGNTPLYELKGLERKLNYTGKILAKLEYLNPTGSAKDRAAMSMILKAEEKGKLKPGSVIIEPTSGNTGISIASIGASKGYRVIIVMPDSFSVERQKMIKAYGAEVVLSEGAKGMQGAVDRAKELAAEIPDSFIPSQFDKYDNALAHYETTGPEIYRDTDGLIDIFIAGIGTGGTITGTGCYLKEKNPNVKVIAVEPASSPLLSEGKAGPHAIQGIGPNFVPSILDKEILDEIITVENEAAIHAAKQFASKEGISVGISSGAAINAALRIAKENPGKNIVVLLPDSGDRYMSTALFED